MSYRTRKVVEVKNKIVAPVVVEGKVNTFEMSFNREVINVPRRRHMEIHPGIPKCPRSTQVIVK